MAARWFQYDSAGILTTQIEYDSALSPIATIVDTYDAAGRKINQSGTTYVYDNADRLTNQQKVGQFATFTMDAVGNITVKHQQGTNPMTMAYDAGSRLTTMQQGTARTTYVYDNNGNMLQEITSSRDGTSYTYDRENRMLTRANYVSSTVNQRMTMVYDGDSLRRVKRWVDDAWLGTKVTTFVWDGADYLAEENS